VENQAIAQIEAAHNLQLSNASSQEVVAAVNNATELLKQIERCEEGSDMIDC
jgi:hypothetical protein